MIQLLNNSIISLKELLTVSQYWTSYDLIASDRIFQNISAPGIVDILGGEVGQHRLYYSSRKEAELNAELVSVSPYYVFSRFVQKRRFVS